MIKLRLLLEEKTLNLRWEEVAKLMSAKFIHEHPKQGEAEMEYHNKHILIEDEDGKISVSLVTKIIDDLKEGTEDTGEQLTEETMANLLIEKLQGKGI